MKDSRYYHQARLLLRIMPIIERYPIFALKGGTAINFFIRDMPRLSVDIDLTYIPIDERETALSAINHALENMRKDIERLIPDVIVISKTVQDNLAGLSVRAADSIVKIEPNSVLRGTIYKPAILSVTHRVQEEFGVAVETRVLDIADLYGGKICAALDRQHPRDLFDVKCLLENEGITDSIRKSFVVHLVSHGQPMAELLSPHYQDIKIVFEKEFEGMCFDRISLPELEDARDKLVAIIRQGLTDKERQFILSVKKGEPEWELLGLKGIERLPAVQWKLFNLSRMDKKKLKAAISKLEFALSL
jgi:hypothetical protein